LIIQNGVIWARGLATIEAIEAAALVKYSGVQVEFGTLA